MKLAVLVPDPGLPEPWAWAFDVEAAVLRSTGAEVDAIPWTAVPDLSGFDLVLPLVAWGYNRRYAEWLALLDRFEAERAPVANPVPVLRWSSDKSYLEELGAAGVPTVPTVHSDALDEAALAAARDHFGCSRLVVKPPVSASGDGTYMVDRGAPIPADALGRPMMIQPWIETIVQGEFSLMLFDGIASHCVVKRPRPGEFRVQPQFGGSTEPCPIPPGAEAIARAALALAPGHCSYARVDLVADGTAGLQVIELELVEPALFLDHAPDRGAAFARSVLAAAKRPAEQPLAQR